MVEFIWQHEVMHGMAFGGLWWPGQQTLLIADPHFGKGASLRARGVQIPWGSTRDDLEHLDRVLQQTAAQSLYVVGDFFHSRHSQSQEVLEVLEQWRQRNRHLPVHLILGNHDRHAGVPPDSLGITCHVDEMVLGGITLSHYPQPDPAEPRICGHLHPGIRLRGRGRSTLRTACLWVQPRQIILPAFGSLTGLQEITPHVHDRVYAIHREDVAEVPIDFA